MRTAVVALAFLALTGAVAWWLHRANAPTAPDDGPAPAITVRVLDVGQGDATYVHTGTSRILIDGGPDRERLGALLDSLGIADVTLDAVVLTHAHQDHYAGLLAVFDTRRHLHVRAFYENGDPATGPVLTELRDSVAARRRSDGLALRDTDDPCDDGRAVCVLELAGGARLDILRPPDAIASPNNRSAMLKLLGADPAAFSMWLAGDAEHEELMDAERAGYARSPGMRAEILHADHHGSCNGVSARYLALVQPAWALVSVGAGNDYGHMHLQAKRTYRAAGVRWYRTDENGTITVRAPGVAGIGYTVTPSRPGVDRNGAADRVSRQPACDGM